MKKTNIIWALMVMLSMSSCSGFTKAAYRSVYSPVRKQDVERFNGTYQFFPSVEFYDFSRRSEANIHDDSTRKHRYLSHFLLSSPNGDVIQVDSVDVAESDLSFNLHFENKRQVKLTVLKNNQPYTSILLNGRMRNGMFHFKKKYRKIQLIPYFFGDKHVIKYRMALTIKGHLIVNKMDNIQGYLIAPIFGQLENISEQYDKVKDER